MACAAARQVEDALQFSFVRRKALIPVKGCRRRTIRPAGLAAVLACIFFGLMLIAKATGHWRANLQREMYIDLVSHANEEVRPGM